jgi:hypothetical protein
MTSEKYNFKKIPQKLGRKLLGQKMRNYGGT